MSKVNRLVENERNLNKILFNARKTIKEKEKEIELIKAQIKTMSSLGTVPLSGNQLTSAHIIDNPKAETKRVSVGSANSKGSSGQVLAELKTKSVQKYGPNSGRSLLHNKESLGNGYKTQPCLKCPLLEEENKSLV